jgi:hypothetical protein
MSAATVSIGKSVFFKVVLKGKKGCGEFRG